MSIPASPRDRPPRLGLPGPAALALALVGCDPAGATAAHPMPAAAAPARAAARPGGATVEAPAESAGDHGGTARAVRRPGGPVRFVASASGAFPSHTQVSLEQDVALVRRVLGDPGVVLLAAGPDAPAIQVRIPETDPVRAALRDLFAPQHPGAVRYRAPEIAVDGPADRITVLAWIERASQEGTGPLLVYLGGHGEQGASPEENRIVTWGGEGIDSRDLAEALTGRTRPVVIVSSACFSGGLAQVVRIAGTSPDAPVVCGLFAAPWDLEATGCNPNPDRSAQQGFAFHLFSVLAGTEPDGSAPTPPADLDGDGRRSLLEAHAHVRIHAPTVDVPTLSSSAFLQAAAPAKGPAREVSLPVEESVAAALSQRLAFSGDLAALSAALSQADEEAAAARAEVEGAQAAEDDAYRAVAAEILARHPVLDDPWSPAFESSLAAAGAILGAYFERSPAYARYLEARARTQAAAARALAAQVRAAAFERLYRAEATRAAAARLSAADRDAFATYLRLRRCEALVPRLEGDDNPQPGRP